MEVKRPKQQRFFTMRVPEDWFVNLRSICDRKARTATAHLKRAVEIAEIVDEACGGNDDPQFIKQKLCDSMILCKGKATKKGRESN